MAKKDSEFLWYVILGGLAYYVLTQRAQGILNIPAGVTGSPLPSGGSSNTSPDILTGPYTTPTDNGMVAVFDPNFWHPPMQLPPETTVGGPIAWM